MTWTRILAVDPGLGGALVTLAVDHIGGRISDRLSMRTVRTPILKPTKGKAHYDERACARLLREWKLDAERDGDELRGLAVEDFVAIPRTFGDGTVTGTAQAFRQGYGLGLWYGLAAGLELPVFRVRPQAWQASQLVGLPRGAQVKQSAARRALDLFPSLELKSKADWGIADALLIARHVLWQQGLVPMPRAGKPLEVIE